MQNKISKRQKRIVIRRVGKKIENEMMNKKGIPATVTKVYHRNVGIILFWNLEGIVA